MGLNRKRGMMCEWMRSPSREQRAHAPRTAFRATSMAHAPSSPAGFRPETAEATGEAAKQYGRQETGARGAKASPHPSGEIRCWQSPANATPRHVSAEAAATSPSAATAAMQVSAKREGDPRRRGGEPMESDISMKIGGLGVKGEILQPPARRGDRAQSQVRRDARADGKRGAHNRCGEPRGCEGGRHTPQSDSGG